MITNTLESQSLRGKLSYDVPLADYTSWRVGGKAQRFYEPKDAADLAVFMSQLPETEAWLCLGLGSNLLVRDGGFSGTVIHMQGCLTDLKLLDEQTVYAEAGVACAQLARFTARLGLQGLEFLAGVPGTVGGALTMNAGCHGGETWPHVSAVTTLSRTGSIHRRLPEAYQIGYRSVVGQSPEIFLAGEFTLPQGDKTASLALIRELLDRRAATQPIDYPNCGSVFRNPPGDHAARLIESIGLKGHRLGGARVSTKHANFIVNEDHATATDLEALIAFVQQRVASETGVELIPEVRIVGETMV